MIYGARKSSFGPAETLCRKD